MHETYLITQIRRQNRRVFIASLLCIMVALGGGFVGKDYIAQAFDDFSTHDARTNAFIVLGFLLLVIGIGCYGFVLALVRSNHWERHPAVKQLLRFGTPDEMLWRFEKEIQETGETGRLDFSSKIQTLWMTKSWLFWQSGLHVTLIWLQDLVWAYEKKVQARAYGIPAGKTYSVEIYEKSGKWRSLPFLRNQEIPFAFVAALSQRCPWLFVGYTEENKQLWHSHRREMVTRAEATQKQLQQQK